MIQDPFIELIIIQDSLIIKFENHMSQKKQHVENVVAIVLLAYLVAYVVEGVVLQQVDLVVVVFVAVAILRSLSWIKGLI